MTLSNILRAAISVLSLLTFAEAVPTVGKHLAAREVKLPNNDQFYQAPANIESYALGSILSYRRVPKPISLTGTSPIRPKDAWQIQYRTQDSLGNAEMGIVTVLVPFNAKPGNLFVENFLSDSAYNACNPSLALQEGDRSDNQGTHTQTMIIVAALNQGWIVSVPDDTGVQGAYTSGLHSAYSTLDSIRAVIQSGHLTGISSSPVITINGYSGGSIPAGWASELRGSYAPELHIAGVALGGISPNSTALFSLINNGSHPLFAASSLLGVSHDYPEMAEWLKENLEPSTEQEFRMAENQCLGSDNMYQGKDLGKYFKRGLNSLLDAVPQKVIQDTAIMGLRGVPKEPWYLYQSVSDSMFPIKLVDDLVENYCSKGANIFFERNSGKTDHSEEALVGFPGAFTWLKERHSKLPVSEGCQTVPVSLSSLAGYGSNVIGTTLFQNFLALLGVPIIGGLR